LVSVLIGVAVAAPSAPGFLGTFELGCVAALAYTKIHSQEFAIAYAIVTHMLQVVMIVACGIWTLRLRRLSFAELSASAEENA
ncbi:MAG: hypothetical protein KDD44_14860, partial [Bdellovibrionales bacterium]|nr:hypothetical protein [Bdellovibrionales bacterium]